MSEAGGDGIDSCFFCFKLLDRFVGDLNVAVDETTLARAIDSSKISEICDFESLDDDLDEVECSLLPGNFFKFDGIIAARSTDISLVLFRDGSYSKK